MVNQTKAKVKWFASTRLSNPPEINRRDDNKVTHKSVAFKIIAVCFMIFWILKGYNTFDNLYRWAYLWLCLRSILLQAGILILVSLF